MTELKPTVSERYAQVNATIASAAEASGRAADDVTIVAVTKKHSVERILEVADLGISDIGENYVQEMVTKLDEIDRPLRWHYVGRLQRNKVKYIIGRAVLFHAIDSIRLLNQIEKEAAKTDVVQDCLLSVNVAGEASKSGVTPDEAKQLVDHTSTLDHVRCIGFMTMPPLAETKDQNRPYFESLRQLRDDIGQDDICHLSMGTSADYESAIAEGATLVRLGTVLVGPRPD